MTCTIILARNADYKQIVTAVSAWDTEPYIDWQRIDEMMDVLDLSSRKG